MTHEEQRVTHVPHPSAARQEGRDRRVRVQRRGAVVVLLLFLLAGALLRLIALDRFPPGLHFDEAVYGLLARDILHGARPVFFSAYTGREPLYMYLMALVQALVGVNTLAIRLTSALIGIATLPLTYLLARELFDRRVALLATGVLALSYWHLTVSRNGYPNVLIPPLEALSVYFLWRGCSSDRYSGISDRCSVTGDRCSVNTEHRFALGGFFAGLVLYTYLAARFFPIALLVIAGYAFVVARERFVRRLPGLGVAVLTAAVTVAPLAWHFFHHPHDFWERASQVSPLRAASGAGGVLRLFAHNAWQTLGGFLVRGDPRPHFNLPGKPIFDPMLGAFFLLGLAVALRRWRRLPYGIVLLWTAVMCLPGVLTADLQPATQRMFGVFPALAILPALGLAWGYEHVMAWRPRLTPVATVAIALLFVWEGASTARTYFGDWVLRYETYEIFNGDYAQMADLARREMAAGHTVVFVSEHYKHPTLAYLAPETMGAVWTLGERGVVFPRRGTDQTVYLVPREPFPPDSRVDRVLRRRAVEIDVVPDFAGRPAFTVYRLPPPANDSIATGPSFNGEAVFVDAEWPPATARGGVLLITVRWEVLRPVDGARTFAIHLVDAQDVRWAQTDEMSYLAEQWRPGDRVLQWFHLPIAPTIPAGTYRLQLVLADAATNPLPVLDATGRPQGLALELGTVRLTAEGGRVQPPGEGIDLAPGLRLLERSAVRGTLGPGARFEWNALWQRVGPVAGDPRLQVELVREGQVWATFQHPLAGSYPPSAWREGEVVRGRYALTLPADAPEGATQVRMRIPGTPTAVELGTLHIEAVARRFELPPIPFPLKATLGERVRFLGYDLPRRTFHPGEAVPLTLYWQALAPIDGNYKVFTHLLDPGGQVRGQQDNVPVEGKRPTDGWLPGEVIEDRYEIPLPPDAPPGRYQIEIGMYDPQTLQRLSVRDAAGQRLSDDRILLAEIEVTFDGPGPGG